MNPILLVDDDKDDLMLIQEAMQTLKIDRPIRYFQTGNDLIEDLRKSNESPFLVICDVNLPGKSGFDVKREISSDEELRYKSVPFIFWSTNASERDVRHAYDLPAQGFFIKPSEFGELCETLRMIMEYWQKSLHPKSVK